MNRRTIAYLVATAACVSLGSLASMAGQATGDQWSVTPTMSMPGMGAIPMPPQQVCSPANWTQPPAGSGPDPSCVNSNFAMSGNTATWTITCQNPPSTGTGQITRMGAGAWTGSINFMSAQGAMTINLSATRSGSCTPS